MKQILLFALLLLTNIAFSQDIVYDSILGDRSYWRTIRYGAKEELVEIGYENTGIIVRSKVLLSARVWDGLIENTDYTLSNFNNDTVVFEFNTSPVLNMITYKYYYNDSSYYSFIGLRKTELGSDLFTGQYLFVCPVIKGSHINIFNGIGAGRSILYSIDASEIDEGFYTDLNIQNKVTFQVIHGGSRLIRGRVLEITTAEKVVNTDEMKVYPNPMIDLLNIECNNTNDIVIRVYDIKPSVVYSEHSSPGNITINISKLPPGQYILVITDSKNGNILTKKKLIKQNK